MSLSHRVLFNTHIIRPIMYKTLDLTKYIYICMYTSDPKDSGH